MKHSRTHLVTASLSQDPSRGVRKSNKAETRVCTPRSNMPFVPSELGLKPISPSRLHQKNWPEPLNKSWPAGCMSAPPSESIWLAA